MDKVSGDVYKRQGKGYLHPVLSGKGTLPASWFRQFAGYETAG